MTVYARTSLRIKLRSALYFNSRKKNERLKKQMLLLNVFGKGWFQNNAAIMNVNNVCIMMALSSQGIENAL